MLVLKQKYLFLLLAALLPLAVSAAWSEPTQNPPDGNTALPVYTTGTGQTIDGTLHVGTPGSYATGLQGSGSTNGVQGNSAANALFGNLSTGGGAGSRAVYGLAVDVDDYALYSSGGLGLGFASGDIWFLQRNAGIGFPHTNGSYGSVSALKVMTDGETQIRSLGNGINFMKVTGAAPGTLTSLLTISEAGAVNAVNSLTVGGTPVCLQNGTGCPVITTPNLQQVTNAGNTTNNQILLTPANSVEALRIISSNYSPIVVRNTPDSADLFRVNQNGDGSFAGNLTVSGQNVCRQNGTNCPPPPPPSTYYWVPVSGTNDIQSEPSGAVRIRHELLFDSFNTAGNFIDFDPWQGSLGNYFLIKSGYNPTYGERWHTRINRTGETLIGSDLFVGNGNTQGVGIMTPYDNPSANTAWAIRGKNTPTIEAVPGGGVGSVGDINLKSGTLKLQWLNSDAGDVKINDWIDAQWGIWNSTANNGGGLYVPDDLKVTGGGAFGNYNPDVNYRVTTPSLYAYSGLLEQGIVGWDVTGGWKGAGALNAKQLCIQGDCKASWTAAGGGWSDNGDNVYLTDSGNFVGIGVTPTPPFVKLRVYPQNLVEGLRIKSSDYSPFIIRNSADSQDLFRVNENGYISSYADMNISSTNGSIRLNDTTNISGDLTVSGINNRIGGATNLVPLAVKTDTLGNGIVVECGVAGCNNRLHMDVANNNYAAIEVIDGASGVKNLVLQQNYGGINGGYVGIGTTAPNRQLHIKTVSGNAEFDIQSVSSPYWAMYQDDGTDDLRFWNSNDRLILKTNGTISVPGTLSIGSMASNPYLRTETFADKTALGIKDPNGNALIYFGSDTAIGGGNGVTVTSNLYFTDTGGNPYGWIINNGGSLTAVMQKYCFGSDCKTGWGPNNGQRVYKQTATPGDGLDYTCDPGYVMVGIKNTSPGQLICDRMW